MTTPLGGSPPPPTQPSKGRATTVLILGILGLICCGILAPIAWYMGNQELKAIREGRAPAEGEGMAKAGMILGIIGTILLAFWILWFFVFGGLAVIGGMMEAVG